MPDFNEEFEYKAMKLYIWYLKNYNTDEYMEVKRQFYKF